MKKPVRYSSTKSDSTHPSLNLATNYMTNSTTRRTCFVITPTGHRHLSGPRRSYTSEKLVVVVDQLAVVVVVVVVAVVVWALVGYVMVHGFVSHRIQPGYYSWSPNNHQSRFYETHVFHQILQAVWRESTSAQSHVAEGAPCTALGTSSGRRRSWAVRVGTP